MLSARETHTMVKSNLSKSVSDYQKTANGQVIHVPAPFRQGRDRDSTQPAEQVSKAARQQSVAVAHQHHPLVNNSCHGVQYIQTRSSTEYTNVKTISTTSRLSDSCWASRVSRPASSRCMMLLAKFASRSVDTRPWVMSCSYMCRTASLVRSAGLIWRLCMYASSASCIASLSSFNATYLFCHSETLLDRMPS